MKRIAPLTLLSLLAACAGVQSSASSDGYESSAIGGLFGLFFWTTLAVYLFVLVYLAIAVRQGRARRDAQSGIQGEPAPGSESRWHLGLTLFVAATATILFVFSLATWFTDRSIAQATAHPALEVEVIGHQWWWEVRYKDPVAAKVVRTANELVIPAGAVTHVKLSSQDVIHSLWIPNLSGKQDLIPGRYTGLELKPLHAGEYRSQCAEFCGLQHAKMALTVTVKPQADFAAWYGTQLQAPPVPPGGPALTGYAIFQGRQCSSCHAVSGTPASGQVAPDLTHVASRKTIASGTMPNTPVNMRSWIADPQAIKPGNNMPKVPLSSSELDAVTAYLETLK